MTIRVVTLAPWPKAVAEVAVAPVVVVVVASVDDAVVEDVALGSAEVAALGVAEVVALGVAEVVALGAVEVVALGAVELELEVVAPGSLGGVDELVAGCWSGVADEVDCCAMAAPAIRAEAAAAVARILRVMV